MLVLSSLSLPDCLSPHWPPLESEPCPGECPPAGDAPTELGGGVAGNTYM